MPNRDQHRRPTTARARTAVLAAAVTVTATVLSTCGAFAATRPAAAAADPVAAMADVAAAADTAAAAAEQERARTAAAWRRWVLLRDIEPGEAPPLVAATLRSDAATLVRDYTFAVLASAITDDTSVAAALVERWRETTPARRAAVLWALRQHGDPYVWGGTGPDGFDCSGLTAGAWAQVGVTLPHWSFGQNAATTDIGPGDARVGDLVFWDSGWNTLRGVRAGHVALHLGAGDLIVEAAGDAVRAGPLHTRSDIVAHGRVDAPDDTDQ